MKPRAAALALVLLACASEHEPTPRERASEALRALTDEIRREATLDPAVDIDALGDQALAALQRSTGDDREATIAATDLLLRGLGKGHTGIFRAPPAGERSPRLECPDALFPVHRNGVGACLAPVGDGLVVSFARADNRLGVRPGDRIVAIGGVRGAEVFARYETVPRCGALSPSPSGRRTTAAGAVLALTPPGTDLEIVDVHGVARTVKMPEQPTRELVCLDVFGRPYDAPPSVTIRPDGIRVLRLASFGGEAESKGAQDSADRLLAAVAELNQAERVIWDLRGNIGGLYDLAAGIAATLPGTRPDVVLRCENDLVAEKAPQALSSTLIGNARRAAVLVDGGSYSAASLFARLAKRTSSAIIVGTEDAGAYSNRQKTFVMPGFDVFYDRALCRDAITGEVAEGRPLPVDLRVELDPVDVANGRDTVLEAAAQALLATPP